MKIDAHQHFWKYSATEFGWIDDNMSVLKKDFLPEDLQPFLQRQGLEASIAVQARQSPEETRWLLELARQHGFIAGVVGWVDLRSYNLEEQLRSLSQNPKLVGLRHVLQDEADDRFMLREDFLRGIDTLKSFNLAYDILIFSRHLPVTCEFVESFPEQRFVVDHIAKPDIKGGRIKEWQQGIQRLAAFPNVCCKVSGMVTEADRMKWQYEDFVPFLDIVFAAFGTKRIMFGSDWPVCTVAAGYDKVAALFARYIDSLALDAGQVQALWGGNAENFYRLTQA